MDKRDVVARWAVPEELAIPRPPVIDPPAKWAYERLGRMVKEFEAELDDEHEVGAGLVCFGVSTEFHIQHIGYWGPDIITFYGVNDKGERVQLIQNVSQLSVLLVAKKKLGDKARRIGFLWDDEPKTKASDTAPSQPGP